MSLNMSIFGNLADSGRRYVSIVAENGSATLPYETFNLANTKLASDLNQAGLPLFVEEDLDAIITEVRALKDFIPGRVIDHIGWGQKYFALLDRTVVCGEGPQPEVLYLAGGCVGSKGTNTKWKKYAALPLKDHPIPAFALMAMFLPPLLRFMPQIGSPIFELVGKGSIGKSVTQVIAASALGPRAYVNALRNVQRDLAAVQRDTRDHPVIIDHVTPALAAATKPKKAETFIALDYDLNQAPGNRVALLSGRRELRDACGMTSNEDRIISLVIPDGPFGVFAGLPDGFASCAGFADSLLAAAADNHGWAYPRFIRKLHRDLTTDAEAVRSRITRLHAKFLREAVPEGVGGIAHRDASVIAAVYVAGVLARRYLVLPKQFDCMAIALAVHSLHSESSSTCASYTDRLEELIQSSRLVTITPEADETTQAAVSAAALGTITVKGGQRIVKIPPEKIEQAFPDWKRIRNTQAVRDLLKVDGKNLATWGTLAPGMNRQRLHHFALPLAPVVSAFDVVDHDRNTSGDA